MHSPNPGFCCLLQHVSSIITRLLPLVTPALDSNISTLVRAGSPVRVAAGVQLPRGPLCPDIPGGRVPGLLSGHAGVSPLPEPTPPAGRVHHPGARPGAGPAPVRAPPRLAAAPGP